MVVSFSRVRCVFECCWFGCRCRGDGGRGTYWLFESAAHKHGFPWSPTRAILRRGEPNRFVREIAVVSEDSGWL